MRRGLLPPTGGLVVTAGMMQGVSADRSDLPKYLEGPRAGKCYRAVLGKTQIAIDRSLGETSSYPPGEDWRPVSLCSQSAIMGALRGGRAGWNRLE